MNSREYTFTFDDLAAPPARSHVSMVSHHSGRRYATAIAVDDRPLLFRENQRLPAEAADLEDLATAVYVADRLAVGSRVARRSLHLSIPLRCPDLFRDGQTARRLSDVLYWFTGDEWHFHFPGRSAQGRRAELQASMGFPPAGGSSTEVALWSGGLDSCAGLVGRLLDDGRHDRTHVLVSTGGSTFMNGVQRKVASEVARRWPERARLAQVPIWLRGANGLRKNDRVRARGFVFLLLGAVCAYLHGQSALYVYENGVGAINLPFRRSEVGWDHSRAVHPRSLYDVGELVSRILEQPFVIHNPFLFSTKGQMCQALAGEEADGLAEVTVSCDGRHRRRNEPVQCGYCSSCMLRRQALAVAGISDRTLYVVTVDEARSSLARDDHLLAMRDQVRDLGHALRAADPPFALRHRYWHLSSIVDQIARGERLPQAAVTGKLHELYARYVAEWEQVGPAISAGLLADPTTGWAA